MIPVALIFPRVTHPLSYVRPNGAVTCVQVFALAVLDNAVNLGAIIFAVHISGVSGEKVVRRSIHGITSGASNMTASVPDKMGLTGARGAAVSSSHSHIR